MTISPRPEAVKHDERRKDVGLSTNESITVYRFAYISHLVSKKDDNPILVLAWLKTSPLRLFHAQFMKSTKMSKHYPSSNVPFQLARELLLAIIKEPLRIMTTAYEGHPENQLSLAVCHFQLISTNTQTQVRIAHPFHQWVKPLEEAFV